MSEEKENAGKFDARFLRLKTLFDRLNSFEEAVVLVQSPNVEVAGKTLVALGLAKQAGIILTTACESMGFNIRTLAMDLPTDGDTIEKVVGQLAKAAEAIAKGVTKTYGINQDAANAYLPMVIDELTDIAEDLVNRAAKHIDAAKLANVPSVPQADGDDGQRTDAAIQDAGQ